MIRQHILDILCPKTIPRKNKCRLQKLLCEMAFSALSGESSHIVKSSERGSHNHWLNKPAPCALYLLSRTWRFTEADSNWAGKQVYFPESEVSACNMVNVLTVVPSAICSGGVVCSLAPLTLPILRAEVARGKWWLLCLHSIYVGGTKIKLSVN